MNKATLVKLREIHDTDTTFATWDFNNLASEMVISSSFTLEKNALFLEHHVIQFTLSTCIGIQAVLHLQCSNTGLSARVHDCS